MADVDLRALIQQKESIDHQLAQMEAQALTELVDAKDAHRADPSEANRLRKAAAVTQIQRLRGYQRAGRTGTRVGGDAFLSPTQNEG